MGDDGSLFQKKFNTGSKLNDKCRNIFVKTKRQLDLAARGWRLPDRGW